MRFSVIAVAMCIAASGAHAQSLTREQTIADVSAKIGEIQAAASPALAQYQMGHAQASIIAAAVERALTMAVNLRDELSSNPYVRVAGFSVGFPAGVTVELEFPPASP